MLGTALCEPQSYPIPLLSGEGGIENEITEGGVTVDVTLQASGVKGFALHSVGIHILNTRLTISAARSMFPSCTL